MTHRLTFEGDRREFGSPALCCCCETDVDPASPRESHEVEPSPRGRGSAYGSKRNNPSPAVPT
jgi:hypothetical protein